MSKYLKTKVLPVVFVLLVVAAMALAAGAPYAWGTGG